MASVTRQSTVTSTSPQILKKIEQEIVNEAKNEERGLKAAVKDLHHIEKDEHKANKASEKHEQSTLKNLYKAENAHNVALSSVTRAQHDYELSTRKYTKAREALKTKAVRVEEAMKANDEHTKSRNGRLTALRGPSVADEAGRVIPDSIT